MTTSITLRATKGTPLTHNEVDANFTNLQTTADAAASDASQGLNTKANASAVGIASGDANMGTYTGTTIPDNETAKQNLQSLETAVETKANASAVGITASATNMGTYTGSTIPDSQTAKQNIQSLETELELKNTALGIALGASNLGTFTGSIISDNTNVKTALQEVETAVGFTQTGTGAVYRAPQAKMRDVVSVKDFGAVGDGSTDDTAAIQAAITACAGQTAGRTVHFPAGDYYISAEISVPNFTHITGDGPYKSRINLQGKPYTGKIFVNSDATTWGWLLIENFGFRAGSHALYNDASSQESWVIRNCVFEIQTASGITSENDFQINKLSDCVFYSCNRAIDVQAGFVNFNSFDRCEFNLLAFESIRTNGSCEVNNFEGCRFEGGYVSGRSVVTLIGSRNANFTGCYFENCHDILLNQTGGGGSGTIFEGCHFTYPSAGVPFIFDSNVPVIFGTNSWTLASEGPSTMMVKGLNSGQLGGNNKIYLDQTNQTQNLVGDSTVLAAGSNTVDAVILSHTFTENTLSDMSALAGFLTVLVYQTVTGGFEGVISQEIPVVARVVGAGAFTVNFGTAQTLYDSTAGGITITPSFVSGTTIRLTIAGIDVNKVAAIATWTFKTVSGANPGYKLLTADFA
jgi:hypothetical protein